MHRTNFERSRDQHPVYFSNPGSLEQILKQHDAHAENITAVHKIGYESIAKDHESILKSAPKPLSGEYVEQCLSVTENHVKIAGQSSPIQIERVVQEVATVLPMLFDKHDLTTFESVRSNARTYGLGSIYVTDALNTASSRTVRAAFVEPTGQKAKSESYSRSTSTDDFIRDTYREGFFGQGRRTSQEAPTQTPQPEQPKPDDEVADLIKLIVARNKQYIWMENESPADVRRVMATVRVLRETAKAEGGTISDRKIYIRYRAKAETKPHLIRAVQILEAMMNGDLNGQLPF